MFWLLANKYHHWDHMISPKRFHVIKQLWSQRQVYGIPESLIWLILNQIKMRRTHELYVIRDPCLVHPDILIILNQHMHLCIHTILWAVRTNTSVYYFDRRGLRSSEAFEGEIFRLIASGYLYSAGQEACLMIWKSMVMTMTQVLCTIVTGQRVWANTTSGHS